MLKTLIVITLILLLVGGLAGAWWCLLAFGALVYVTFKYDHWFSKPKQAYIKNPCPRCANEYVNLYSQGRWMYFTCGWCGARGYYPFMDPALKEAHLNRYRHEA